MNSNKTDKLKFTLFKAPIDSFEIPQSFPYPYSYRPHPLCVLAADELQQFIENQTAWEYDFDIENLMAEPNLGKMFGVLVVEDSNGQIGYLSAFSGVLAGKNLWPGFVPPVADILMEGDFFREGEKEIDDLNGRIRHIENSIEYVELTKTLESELKSYTLETGRLKKELKEARKKRKIIREEKRTILDEQQYRALEHELENQSRREKYDYRVMKKSWSQRIELMQNSLRAYTREIGALKSLRKEKSTALQNQIFDKYNFLNQAGEIQGVREIFADTPQKFPPAAAGDCAAPKLLQYAFKNNLKPLALAEFWWGQSPRSEIRKHGFFYPPCKGKCQPILRHMLKGIKLDADPLLKVSTKKLNIEVVFEDDAIMVINKPSNLLSAPGKITDDSVYKRIKEKYPDFNGPLIVHRLDMSTSGIMVIAKTDYSYKKIQSQFINGTIKKNYIALLDGMVSEKEGTIDLPLRGDYNDRPRQIVCREYGKTAITKWKFLQYSYLDQKSCSKVLFIPINGRTHQLRVHAAHPDGLNMPIRGDNLYGISDTRLYLHAQRIEFKHPATNELLSFQVDEDF